MGLIRSSFKILKYITVFSLGYYFGSVKSDNYNCIFNSDSTSSIIENSVDSKKDLKNIIVNYSFLEKKLYEDTTSFNNSSVGSSKISSKLFFENFIDVYSKNFVKKS